VRPVLAAEYTSDGHLDTASCGPRDGP